MKRVWKNLTKGKKIGGILALILVASAGFFTFRHFNVHADNQTKRVVNDISELGTIDTNAAKGTASNPFVILEIVPYVGKAEFGYLIDGCEPYDVKASGDLLTTVYNNGVAAGTELTKVFGDEKDAVPEEYIKDGTWAEKSGTAKCAGYYEKVASGGNFKISGYTADTSGTLAEGTVYVPTFERVYDNSGDFDWTSLANVDNGSYGRLKDYQLQENKYTTDATKGIVYEVGDREYTIRDNSNEQDPKIWTYTRNDVYYKTMIFKNHNMFLRTCLGLRTPQEIEDYNIVVKTIEPKELNENPQWLDYANLIYLKNSGSESGATGNIWNNSKYDQYRRVRDTGTGNMNSDFSSEGDKDFTWSTARDLYFKINGLDKYNGSGQYEIAPLIMNATVLDNLKTPGCTQFASTRKENAVQPNIDYTTLDPIEYNKGQVDTTIANKSNIYKFLVMNYLMDQEEFYNHFFIDSRKSTGAPVIDMETGKVTTLPEADQDYWSPNIFLPRGDKGYYNGYSEDLLAFYKIAHASNSFLNFANGNLVLRNWSFVYNSDSSVIKAFDQMNLNSNHQAINNAFQWFSSKDGESKDYAMLTPAQMIKYLLNYKKSSDPREGSDSNKLQVNILEIEPCNDFIWNSTMVHAYFPPSTYNVTVDSMTTQEFNGIKDNILGKYHIVYVGMTDGKFNKIKKTIKADGANLEKDYVNLNDADFSEDAKDRKLGGKIYLHVGDLVKAAASANLRFSGNDISTIKCDTLKQYASSNAGVLILDDTLMANSKDIHNIQVDSSAKSQINNMVKAVKNKSSVCKYSSIQNSVLGLKNKLFSNKTICKSLINITGTPKIYDGSKNSYLDITSTDNDGEACKLNFKFEIKKSEYDDKFSVKVDDTLNAKKYGIKIYMDIDYDGVITDNDVKSELIYDSVKNGEEFEQPTSYKPGFSYSFGYDFIQNVYKKRKLTARRDGAVTWKFEVYDIDDSDYNVSASGVSWYHHDEKAADEKNVVKYLQIVSDNDALESAQNLHNNTLFEQYTQNLPDYSISEESITATIDEYFTMYNTDIKPITEESKKLDQILSKYDMLIISCGSDLLKKASENQEAVDYIKKLSDNGFSILYTGNAVDTSNNNDGSSVADFKNMLDQSRFLSEDTNIKDTPTYALGKLIAKSNTYSLSEYASLEYTYATVTRFGTDSNGKLCFNNNKWKTNSGSKVEYGASKSDLSTDTLTKINSGKLSSYPYTISKKLKCHPSTAQEYQLNMNAPDLTVWYCLGGEDDTTYGISPNDATNNYYLYTYDNVAYINANLAAMQTNKCDEEMQLFVNTLVANYDVGTSYPRVEVTKMDPIDSNAKPVEVIASDNYENTDSILYYDAIMPEMQKQYLDYKPNETPIVVETPEPAIESMEPEATPEPDPTEDPANGNGVESGETEIVDTPEPEDTLPDPIICDASNKYYFTYNSADTMKTITNDTLIVIRASKGSRGDSEQACNIQFCGNPWTTKDYQPKFSSMKVNSLGQYEIVYKVSDVLKDLGNPANGLAQINASGGGNVEGIDFYYSEKQYNDTSSSASSGSDGDDSDTGSGDSGSTTTTQKVTFDPDRVFKVADEDDNSYFDANKDYTHKIYFKPFDNSMPSGKIQSLKISLVGRKDAKDDSALTPDNVNIYSMIPNIYCTDKATGHVFQYKASQDGTFTIEKKNYTQDAKQYFFLYKEKWMLTSFKYIQFEIKNLKKTGYTYFYPHTVGTPDNTYVFELD